MTIDEYLSQHRTLWNEYEFAKRRSIAREHIATNHRDSLNLGDGVHHKNKENVVETKAINAADAFREWKETYNKYFAFRDQFDEAIDSLLYWEGSLLNKVYILNTFSDDPDDLNGADEILRTTDRRVIISKLNIAKEHLKENLIRAGVELD